MHLSAGGDDINFWQWLRGRFPNKNEFSLTENELFEGLKASAQDYYVRQLMILSAINLYASCLAKCEFKTFADGKSEKDKEYYLWNISPNSNQGATAFKNKLAAQLLLRNEVLIIDLRGQLLVADSWEESEPSVIRMSEFSNVVVNNIEINRIYRQNEVIHIKLSELNTARVLNGLFDSYGGMLSNAIKAHKWRVGIHGTMEISTMRSGGADFTEQYGEVINNYVKPFFEKENGIMPVFEGYKYTDLSNVSRSQESSRDIRAMIDDISDFTGRGYNIPAALLRGDVAGSSDAVDNFLSFGFDAFAKNIENEIDRKRNGYEGFKNGYRLKIDTSNILHFDIFKSAVPVDKNIASGAFSINDMRKAGGQELINEPWADEHFITKNYTSINDLENLEGK